MINAYAVHSLSGCEHYSKQCTCGHNEQVKKRHIHQSIGIKPECCPKCGTPLMTNSMNVLTFAPIQQKGRYAMIKTKNKACYFELFLYDIDFVAKIDFQKKNIKADKRTIKNKMVKMVFDATQKPEDFFKFYNSNNEEICKKDFLEQIGDSTFLMFETNDAFKKFSIASSLFMNKFCKPARVINNLETHRGSFIKYEQIIKSNIDPFPLALGIDSTKTNPIEMLGIRPFTFKYIRNYNKSISLAQLNTIKKMEEKIGDQTVNYLQTFGARPECMDISFIKMVLDLCALADLSVNKLYKYVYKEVPIKQYIINPTEILRLLRDSYEMAKDLGLPFDKNPKHLKRYHDTLMIEYKIIENKIISQKFEKNMEERQYLNYEEQDNKYCIIAPKISNELVQEGSELRHCVGSYIKRVSQGQSIIVFLREKKQPEKSHTTIELSPNNEIIQIKRKHNTSSTDQEAIDLVHSWAAKNCLDLKVHLQAKKGA